LSRRFALLVNPASAGGRALKALPAVQAALDREEAPYRTVTTRSTEHTAEEAAHATEQGETVAALGGDGMLRPIAGALKGTSSAVALIPSGRGNDLARVLGIPADPTAAVRIAVSGRERLLDVANVDGTPYVGIASFGFDSEANRIANEAAARLGDLAYAYSALRALIGWRPARFEIELDGDERRTYVGYSVGAANSRAYGGGMYAAPTAELDDGALDVVVAESMSKLRFLTSLLPRIFKGTHVDMPEVHVMRASRVHLDADRRFVIYADGDPIGATPATVSVEARCLRVIAPS
jgi:YegS/Rv2252/BmrU family lipid kinase